MFICSRFVCYTALVPFAPAPFATRVPQRGTRRATRPRCGTRKSGRGTLQTRLKQSFALRMGRVGPVLDLMAQVPPDTGVQSHIRMRARRGGTG
jgi:hypothetical protein